MAKQIAGLCFLEGAIEDLTFYKMDGQYYCRLKSCLTSERVKTSPRFRLTMMSARRMARASKIGATIYKALPPRWRQFWMYRSFTGEAFTLLKHTALAEEAITTQLHACYVAYWDERRAADPDNEFWQPVPVKIRKPRQYSEETLQRRWDAMQAKRPRKEIRAEKKRQEEARRQAWAEKLAARAAARVTSKAPEANEPGIAIAMDNSPAVHPTAVPALTGNTIFEERSLALGTPPHELLIVVPPVDRQVKTSRQHRCSVQRKRWYITQHGSLQQQSVPAVTRKRQTDTLTMFSGRLCTSGTRHPCDSS